MRLLVAGDSSAICAQTHQRARRPTVPLPSLIIVCFLAVSAVSKQNTPGEKEKKPAVMLQINAPRSGRLFLDADAVSWRMISISLRRTVLLVTFNAECVRQDGKRHRRGV